MKQNKNLRQSLLDTGYHESVAGKTLMIFCFAALANKRESRPRGNPRFRMGAF